MKAVIDTAVLVSTALAIVNDKAAHSRLLVERATSPDSFELVTSEPMLSELADVLSRPQFGLSPEQAIAFGESIASLATVVAIRGLAMGCRDPRDDKVLETALNANADFVVARDRDLHDPRARYSLEKVGPGIRSALIAAALIEV